MVTANHISILGSVTAAVKSAQEKLGYLHRVRVEVSSESEMKEAMDAGADVFILDGMNPEQVKRLADVAKESVIVCSGAITLENVREYAEAGARLIRVEALTNAAPAMKISFNVQPY